MNVSPYYKIQLFLLGYTVLLVGSTFILSTGRQAKWAALLAILGPLASFAYWRYSRAAASYAESQRKDAEELQTLRQEMVLLTAAGHTAILPPPDQVRRRHIGKSRPTAADVAASTPPHFFMDYSARPT